MQRLEERLLATPVLELRFQVEAEGAFSASLVGELRLSELADIELKAAGTFGGEPVDLQLETTEGRMHGGHSAETFGGPLPEHLRPALVLGLTRMGILHNLARLAAGRPPDHAEGGVEEWVRAVDVSWIPDVPEPLAPEQGLRFAVEVAGLDAAQAELWLDADGLPARREQLVRFPGGEMKVSETYEITRIDP